jgi:choline-sulfatase
MNKTNVVFILTDDQGPWALRCSGNSEIETPNLDRLAETGTRFENFFCTSPVCSPARASLLTGRIPSQHGVHDWLRAGNTVDKYEPDRNGELIEYLKGQQGYTDFLSARGYECGISGKWHLGDAHHRQKGFDFWHVHAMGGGPYYGAPMVKEGKVYEEQSYVTDAITNNALHFLEGVRHKDRPFYLSVHYTAPHSPWEREHHPKDIFDRYYRECPFHSVPHGLKPPEWVKDLRIPVEDEEKRRGYLSGYYTAVQEMDRNVGRLINWLEKNGLREKTLIVFTGDNGMNMGHHGVFGKGNATFPLNMFEESVKVPFIMSHPGVIREGGVNSHLLSQYDFMPTLLDYLRIENPDASSLPGRSFVKLLRGKEASDSNSYIVIFDEYGPVRMIRNRDWKYIHRYPYGPNELYSLKEDPEETENLADTRENKDRQADMRRQIRDWFLRYVDPYRDGIYEAVTGLGQTVKVGSTLDT